MLAQVEPGEIRSRLPAAPPDRPEPFAAVLRDLDDVLMPGVTHWQSPRYFAYFATTGSEPGILAELLIAAAQPGRHPLARLAGAAGARGGDARLAAAAARPARRSSTGTSRTPPRSERWRALVAARQAAPGRRVVVCSEHAHSATAKAARILELEVRTVPADERFRLRPDLLELGDACAVVATIGTTSCASVDPVPEIADACAAAGTWLHVDAAYAGAAAVCPELRHHFAGWERADSIGVNPHKWLATPMDCSALWTRRVDAFRDAFSLVPEFLRVSEEVVSLSEVAIPLGRRFRALKLWAVLRCHGRDGLQAMIREHVRLAELFEGWVRDEPGWELAAPRLFSLVCFRLEGGDDANEALLERVNASGEIFLSHTRLDGRYVLRLAIGNARTTEADVRRAWDVLRRAAARS